MSKFLTPPNAIGKLREGLVRWKDNPDYKDIVGSKEDVLARYQPIFSPEKIREISEEEFYSFLLFENNRHWNGLQRHGPKMMADMKKLREAISIVVDESKPIDKRLDQAIGMVHGLGRAVVTAILLVVFPDKYGVWNNTSEEAMKRLDLWPSFDRGESFGSRYLKVNGVLIKVGTDLGLDLWELDALWWAILKEKEPGHESPSVSGTDSRPITPEDQQRFGLERHLHEFLRDNWDRIELFREWEIYKEPGNEEAGYEYPCDVGKIDLLATHKKQKNRWLVIELKRNQTSDQTVGQILRYMGWVKQDLAEKGDKVEGLVISHGADEGMKYALSEVPNVNLKLYEVEFRLKDIDEKREPDPNLVENG